MTVDALEAIRRARATKLVKDGAVVELEPAVPPADIERVELQRADATPLLTWTHT